MVCSQAAPLFEGGGLPEAAAGTLRFRGSALRPAEPASGHCVTAKLKRPKVREAKLRKTVFPGTEHAVATRSRQALGRLQRMVSAERAAKQDAEPTPLKHHAGIKTASLLGARAE